MTQRAPSEPPEGLHRSAYRCFPGNARVPAAMSEVLGFLLALGITVAAIPVLARAAGGWGLLALPGPRRNHDGAVPVVGGLAIGIAFLVCYTLAGPTAGFSPLLAAAVVVTLTGGV